MVRIRHDCDPGTDPPDCFHFEDSGRIALLPANVNADALILTPEYLHRVAERLILQEQDACQWCEACLLYFQQFSQRLLPAGVEPPEDGLDFYQSIRLRTVPGHPGDHWSCHHRGSMRKQYVAHYGLF